jgi:hypothetical protein
LKIEIKLLKENPLNQQIYGDDNEVQLTELVEKIRSSGWIKAILITKDYLIISGHRRVKAARILGIGSIEYEIVDDNPEKQMEIFLNENAYRVKSNLQLLREAEQYRDIEKKKAYQRMSHSTEPMETLPAVEKGNTRDIVAEKIGMSGRSYDKGRNVLEKIDSTHDEIIREFFEKTLDENIDAASKLVEKPTEVVQEIMERTEGDPKKVSGVIREMEHEEIKNGMPLPPGKYQILLLDLTNTVDFYKFNTTISEICEQDCLLFIWVLPHHVDIGIKISQNWGFRYYTCLVWNRDTENELSDNGEVCLVTVKGSPHLIFEHFPAATEKPELLKKVIDIGYPGWSRVEIFKDDGWQIW